LEFFEEAADEAWTIVAAPGADSWVTVLGPSEHDPRQEESDPDTDTTQKRHPQWLVVTLLFFVPIQSNSHFHVARIRGGVGQILGNP